jgi:hypothetical protein
MRRSCLSVDGPFDDPFDQGDAGPRRHVPETGPSKTIRRRPAFFHCPDILRRLPNILRRRPFLRVFQTDLGGPFDGPFDGLFDGPFEGPETGPPTS